MNTSVSEFSSMIAVARRSRPVDALDANETEEARSARYRGASGHYVNQLGRLGQAQPIFDANVTASLDSRRTSFLTQKYIDPSIAMRVLRDLEIPNESGVDAAGRLWSSRAAPSAGGTHSIKGLLALVDAQGIRWFHEQAGVAYEVRSPAKVDLVEMCRPAAKGDTGYASFLFAVAEPDVLFARYPSGAHLLWMDAGAYLTCAQLSATSMNAASTIVSFVEYLSYEKRRYPAVVLGALALTSG
jgi:hypothetical protein